MKVKFRVNLGSMDANRCGLDFKVCTVGSEVECDDVAGKWLVTSGIATDITPPKPKPEPVPEPVVEELPAEPQAEAKHGKHTKKN